MRAEERLQKKLKESIYNSLNHFCEIIVKQAVFFRNLMILEICIEILRLIKNSDRTVFGNKKNLFLQIHATPFVKDSV